MRPWDQAACHRTSTAEVAVLIIAIAMVMLITLQNCLSENSEEGLHSRIWDSFQAHG